MADPTPIPYSRETLKDYALRALGHPVIKINIDDDQMEDRLEEAIQLYQEHHDDGAERLYLRHQVTAGDIANTYIEIPAPVISVTKIFPISAGAGRVNMFDINYQIRLNDIQSFTSLSLIHFYLVQRHVALIDQMFNGQAGVRFTRHQNRLWIDFEWGIDITEGEYLIIECRRVLDPQTWTNIFNDRWLKEYVVQSYKKQWATNLKKYGGVQLVGGVTLNGQILYDEAVAELEKLNERLRSEHESPPHFIVM
jgi:hypothetical protein